MISFSSTFFHRSGIEHLANPQGLPGKASEHPCNRKKVVEEEK